MKFPENPNASPNLNPGIKESRGRITFIIIAAGLVYIIFNSWAAWEQGLEKIWNEITAEIRSEFESEFRTDTTDEYNPSLDYNDETMFDYSELYEPEPQPVPREPEPTYDFDATSTTTYETDLPDDVGRQIFLDSRQQIIDQLTAQGQEDQIPMVLEMLDEMEKSY